MEPWDSRVDLTARVARLEDLLGDLLPETRGDLAVRVRSLEAVANFVDRVRAPILVVGRLELNRGSHTLHVNGRPRELKPVAFDLLWILMSKPGFVFAREDLHCLRHMARGGEAEEYDPVVDRSIDVHISALKRVIGSDRIRSIRGVGYVLFEAQIR